MSAKFSGRTTHPFHSNKSKERIQHMLNKIGAWLTGPTGTAVVGTAIGMIAYHFVIEPAIGLVSKKATTVVREVKKKAKAKKPAPATAS